MRPSGRPTSSFFVRVFTFTVISLVIAQAINMALVLYLPPPVPDFYSPSEIAQTFQGDQRQFSARAALEKVTLGAPPRPPLRGKPTEAFRDQLARELGISPDRIVIAGARGPFADLRVYRQVRERMGEQHYVIAPFEVGIAQPNGRWLVVKPHTGVGLTPSQQRMALWLLVAALVIAPGAYWIARRLSEPVRMFGRAAERLGRDPTAEPVPIPERGSSEIVLAATAFNEMQQRLRRYVEDRTDMVGAIAHDLRTPLTRLRFRVENLPDEQKAKFEADIDQMEAMIAAALAFVRDASRPGQRTPLELSSLLESLCDEMADVGAQTEVEQGERVVLEGDPMALRRLFSNLLENAVKFGGRARARIFREASHAVVEIDDDGPGIPPQDAEKVFEPFYRREPSRSRQTGGIGLGLAVVRSIARGHGGDVSLVNREGGGLTARVLLPL